LHQRLRAFTPWPGTFTFLPASPKPLLLKVASAQPTSGSGLPGEILAADKTGIIVACGADALRLLEVQKEGGRRLPVAEFLAGHPLAPGTRLGAAQ
jgi:methionyl-tRNA formyltransferase